MPIFEVNGQRYNVANEHLDAFSQEFPDASTIEDRNGKSYRVKARDYSNFLSEFDNQSLDVNQDDELGFKTNEATDSLFELNTSIRQEKDPYKRQALEMKRNYLEKEQKKQREEELRNHLENSGEIKRLQEIQGKAQVEIDKASFFDRYFNADTRAAVAARDAAEEALDTYSEAQYKDRDWVDKNVGGVLRGIFDKVGDLRTWDFGASGVASGVALKDAYEKVQRGEAVSNAEQNMLDAYGLASAVQEAYQGQVGMAYRAGGSLPESAAFMGSLILNPAGGVGKKIAETAAKSAVKKYGTSLIGKLAKGAARVGGDIVEMGVATAVPGAGRVAEDYYNRLNGQSVYDIDENGIIRYGGQYEQEEADKAIWKAFGSQFIENYSESVGNYFSPIGSMLANLSSKGLKAAHLGKLAEAVTDISSSQWSKGLQRFKQATKFDGFVGEYLEEVAGNFMNAATVGDMNFSSTEDPRSVFNPETNIETALSCALMSGTMYAVEAPISAYNKYTVKRNLRNADAEASKLWGERWNDMRSQMDAADPELLAQLLTGVENAKDLSAEQKQAAKNYGVRLMQSQGFNARKVQNASENTEDANAASNAYDEGTQQSNEPAYIYQTAKEVKKLGEALKSADETVFNSINTMIQSGVNPEIYFTGLREPILSMAKSYYHSLLKQKGVNDSKVDAAEERIQSDNASIDAATDTQTGNYAQVTAIFSDGAGGTKEVVGNVVGWIGDSPIFVADGMENTEENRRVLKQGEWNPETLIERPAEEVKAINEEMIREEVAHQAEMESEFAPEVLNAQMQQGVPFETLSSQIIPISPLPEGNGWVVEEYPIDVQNKTAKQPIIRELTNDEYRAMLQVKLDVDAEMQRQMNAEAVQAESASSESVGEQVNAPVNTEVNNPMENTESTPMSEEVQSATEEKSTQPQAEQPKQPTLEEVVATLPKNKKGEIDYKSMTPQQQYQYTSLTESPEVALEDLQADIAAGQEEITKKQEQLSKARGGERAALRDEVRKLTQAQAELQSFYDSVASNVEETTPIEEVTEPTAQEEEQPTEVPTQVEAVEEVVSEEEQRRRPLRERAKEWSDALGVDVTIYESVDDIEDEAVRQQVIAIHNSKKLAPGWVTDGKVYFLMSDMADVDEIDNTYIHEVVAHIGMEKLLGKERFAELCDKVWEMMPQSAKDYFYNYPEVSNIKDDTARRRKAADEYIASLAEKENLTPEEQTIWDSIVKMFRDMLDKALNGIIGKSKLTDEDISNLIKASYANLKSGAELGVSGDGTRFRTLEQINSEFNENLQKQIEGALPNGYIYQLGSPSAVLRSAGIEDLPIELAASRLVDKSMQDNHPFELSEVENLPEAIHNPLAVFVSATKVGSNVILTELKHDGKNFVAALRVRPNKKRIEVNQIRSLYPKNTNGIIDWINNGLATYVDKERMAEWVEKQRNELLSKPQSNSVEVREQLVSATKIVNDFENPTLPEEKSLFRVVYHGSAASYDKFSKDFIGSGEGNSVAGYGFYVTSDDSVGRHYADFSSKSKRKVIQSEGYTVNGELVKDSALVNAYNLLKENEFDVEKSISYVEERIEQKKKEPKKGIFGSTKLYENMLVYLQKEQDNPGTLGYQEEVIEQPGRYLYEVEIPDDNGKNYLDLDKSVPKNVKEKAKEKLLEYLYNGEDAEYWENNKSIIEEQWKLVEKKGATAETLRSTMQEIVGREEVSDIFSSMGYIGFKTSEDSERGTTYVIFDESNLNIVNHTRFRVKGISGLKPSEVADKIKDCFYEDVAKSDRIAMVEYLQQNESGKAVIDRMYQHNGTGWARQTANATFVRIALNDLIEGREPSVQSMLTRGREHPVVKYIKQLGKEGVWRYIQTFGLLGEAGKPVNNVNGSFLSCNPSSECAKYCYATKGNYIYAGSSVKSELVYWCIANDPIRAAHRIVDEYKSKPQYYEGKALRLFDKGDIDMAWIPVIEELNKQGVVTQVFSKRPEILERVDKELNVVMMSIDSSNSDMLDEYPTMPVALVYRGNVDSELLEKCKDRLQQYGGVILPVKIGQKLLSENEVKSLPLWTRPYQCPIDNGKRQINDKENPERSWNCTKCDKNGGVGCFFHRTANKLRKDRYENETKSTSGRTERDNQRSSSRNAESSNGGSVPLHSTNGAVGDIEFRRELLRTLRESLAEGGLSDADITPKLLETLDRRLRGMLEGRGTQSSSSTLSTNSLEESREIGQGYERGDRPESDSRIKSEGGTRFRISNQNQEIFAHEPAIDYVSQANDIVEVPRDEVMYTMNNIASQLYKTSGRFMRQLYQNGTLGRVLKGDYAEMDQIKAKNEYDHAKPILDEYLNELVWMKYQATDAAQEVINDVISDVEYAIKYYKDLSLGKDVWRTEERPRFRIVEKQHEDVNKGVDSFTSKYNSKPVSVASSDMTDEELEKAVPTSLVEDTRKAFEEGVKGKYSVKADKIYIFADNVTKEELEDTLFHENLHPMFSGNPIIEEFYTNFNAKYPEQVKMLAEGYEESEVPEEVFVTNLAVGMQRGNFKMVEPFLAESSREDLYNTLKAFGYDYEQERGGRNPERNSGKGSDVAEGKKVANRSRGKEDSEGQREKSREQAEKLRDLFGRVADMGLDGVLGNEAYDRVMMDIYSVLPEDSRKEVIDDAFNHYGMNIAPAVSDYIHGKSDGNILDKIVAIIRNALRKAGFNIDLNGNEVKYLAWRSKKPLDRNNLVDMAEDIYKKYQLKVGEYSTNDDGTTPDGGGTRFRVTPKMDAEYLEAVNSGDMKKAQKMVLDAAKMTMPNTKVVDENGYPKVVYHGGFNLFTEFNGDVQKQNNINTPSGSHFFASSRLAAESYIPKYLQKNVELNTSKIGKRKVMTKDGTFKEILDTRGGIYPVFLNITNPKLVDYQGYYWTGTKDGNKNSNDRIANDTNIETKQAMDEGYDGAIFKNIIDYGAYLPEGQVKEPYNDYVAFNPSQIKSAEAVTYDDNGNVIPLSERFNPEQKDIRFRASNKLQVRDEYEATIKKGGYQAREAVQDAMLSLRRFQELIEKESGKKLKDFENAWMHENRLSSVVQAAIHEMERKFYKPMMESVKKLMKAADIKQEEVADYLMLKHGIERNREMAVRKALTDAEGKIDRAHLEQWYQDKEAIRNDASLDTWRKKQEAMDNLALSYGADMSRDYSGLTSMFDTDDIEECTNRAYDEVEALENAYPAETEALGKAVKAMTQNTLDESFRSGLMDRKVYDELSKDMYDYYIPLRGFEETTSEEVYAYLDQDRGAFNAPLKRAKGRSSKSDNPIAYLKSIAESGIMQGERNKMKQTFLNMVINHPSDLVSIHEGVWVVFNPATGEWEAAAPPAIPNNATPADVEAAMEAWEQQMEQAAQNDPTLVKKVSEASDIPYRVVGNRMNQHQIIVKRLGKSYTLTVNGNPRLAMALNGLTNPNNTSNDGKVSAYVSGKFGALNRFLASVYTTKNPDFVVSNFLRDTFYTNTIVRAKEGNSYANKFHKHYAELLMPGKMISLFKKYENGTLDMSNATEAAFKDFMMNGGETGYSNLKDLENIKKQIAKDLKGNRLEVVEKVAEKLDILNRAVENTARFAAYLTSREEGRSIAKSVFDAKEISVNFNKKGAGGTFFGMTGQTKLGNLAAMVGAGGRALYVFFNAAIQGTTNLLHVMKKSPKGTSAGIAAMFLMGAVLPFLLDDDEEKDYYDLPEHVRRNHLILPGFGDAWISIPLPIEYRIMYGMGELLTSWRTGHERGSDIGRKMLNLTGQALPLNFLEEGFDAFIPSSLSPLWQVYNNKSWTGLPLYKDNEFNKDDPEYTKAYKNVDKTLYNVSKALYDWTFDEENQEAGINLNPAVLEALARGYFGGFATQLGNLGKTWETIAGEREFDWRSIPIGNRVFKSGDERTKEKRITNEYFENMEKLDFMQSRERTLKKTINGVSVPQEDKDRAKEDYDKMKDTDIYKKYQEFKKKKKDVDKLRKRMKEKGSTEELEKKLTTAQEEANKVVR